MIMSMRIESCESPPSLASRGLDDYVGEDFLLVFLCISAFHSGSRFWMIMSMKIESRENLPSLASRGLDDYDDEVFLLVFLSVSAFHTGSTHQQGN